MPRQSKPSELSLQAQNGSSKTIATGANNSPGVNLQGVDLGSFGGGFEHDVASGLTPLPPQSAPQSPPGSPRLQHGQSRDSSKTFLSNFKNRISPDSEQKQKKDSRQGSSEDSEYRPSTSSMSKVYHLRNNPGSTPELSLVGSNENTGKEQTPGDNAPTLPGPRPAPTSQRSEDSTASKRRDKVPFGFGRGNVSRSKSISKSATRRDSDSKSSRPRVNGDSYENQPPPNTAPLQLDSSGPNMGALSLPSRGKDGDKRGKSVERAPANASEENLSRPGKEQRGSHFKMGGVMNNAKSTGGRLFGRLGLKRSDSDDKKKERDIPDSEYQLKVINLPLIEQTRATRISKHLSGCKDKTEYWMPSLPWRCIDYLNTNCEEEGLYRIPGSGPQVKHWQRRFDTELDIDLLSEEVRDTNEIASMLKAWLRELPTEIMPQDLQQNLAAELEKENPQYKNVGQPASQKLRDALSELPPFNYYLLFAITCHLSLLLTNKDRNKMDLNNLAVCVGPCLHLERWLFNYLVGDWRHCWQGCYTEKEYLRTEELHEAGFDADEAVSVQSEAVDSKPASAHDDFPKMNQNQPHHHHRSRSENAS
ncbi:uncharacterized protein RCC_04181 [Lecanosticta acicola]|uniref:Uncharacterized protein RCC_04181 n=1 Tax=Lecanosticta acicola TaxID=111012 RepID=A0AAI8Z096_9PEZI|nr:uncharacterized protein RCC_04181 [Lecanosticta acicola]